MIESRDGTSESERMILQNRARESEPQVLGGISHGWNQGNRIVDRDLSGLGNRCLAVAAVNVVHTDDVRQEQGIELTLFQQLGQLDPIGELRVFLHLVVRTHPKTRRLVDDTVHMESVKIDALAHGLEFGRVG